MYPVTKAENMESVVGICLLCCAISKSVTWRSHRLWKASKQKSGNEFGDFCYFQAVSWTQIFDKVIQYLQAKEEGILPTKTTRKRKCVRNCDKTKQTKMPVIVQIRLVRFKRHIHTLNLIATCWIWARVCHPFLNSSFGRARWRARDVFVNSPVVNGNCLVQWNRLFARKGFNSFIMSNAKLNISGHIHQADCCFSDVFRGRQCAL